MKKLEIALTLLLILWISGIASSQNARRNGTTSRPVSRRGTQRIIPSKRTRNPSIPTTTTTTTSSSTSTSTAATTTTSGTPEATVSAFDSLSTTELSVTSEGNISTLKSPSSTKSTLTAVLVMIVEMRANESLIDQIENSTLNISSKEKDRSGSGVSFPVPKSAKPLAPDVTRHETAIDLMNDLTGHESRPPAAEFKYINASQSPAVLGDDKCWIDGGIACKESRLMCSGFGDIDCRAGECTTSPTLICNMDLGKAKCTGYGSCKKAGEITAAPGVMATTQIIIVVVSITLGVLVLAGTTIYVYLSTSKHKIRPETDSRSDSSSRMDVMNRLGCLGANVYHQ